MNLFFVRHGLAVADHLPDQTRPLTSEGIERTRAAAKFLKKNNLSWDVMLTSPLIRALETAQILQDAGVSQQLKIFTPLEPGGDFGRLKYLTIEESIKSVALVGHQPDLGHWIEMMLFGKIQEKILLKKSGIAHLQWKKGEAELLWLLSPKLFG